MKTYFNVYGVVEDREIFVGQADTEQIATVIANNNLGSDRYFTVLIYEITENDKEVINRNCIARLNI